MTATTHQRGRRSGRRHPRTRRRRPGLRRHRPPLARAARQYGLALLPRPRPSRRNGPGGLSPRLARPRPMAARVQLLHLALCSRGQCFPLRAQALSHGNLPLEAAPEPSAPATQHHVCPRKQASTKLRRAVLALPHRYREPVVLFYFHEMDLAAAACTMGLPEGTIKARLSRARALLRSRFPHLDQESLSPAIAALNTGKEA